MRVLHGLGNANAPTPETQHMQFVLFPDLHVYLFAGVFLTLSTLLLKRSLIVADTMRCASRSFSYVPGRVTVANGSTTGSVGDMADLEA